MPSAVGCDFSTHQVNLARVGARSVEQQLVVKLTGKSYSAQVAEVNAALRQIHSDARGFLIERVFIHPKTAADGGRQNYDTTIRLAGVSAMVRSLAALQGYETQEMLAAEWRPIAGIAARGRNGVLGRLDFKREALALVRLEFGLDLKDDNAAEAILMGRVAQVLHTRQQLIEEATR